MTDTAYTPATVPSNPRPAPPRVSISAPPTPAPTRPRTPPGTFAPRRPTLIRLEAATTVHETTASITLNYPEGRKSDALAALKLAVDQLSAQVRR